MSGLEVDRERFKREAEEKAKNNFRSGCNCAESVFKAIYELVEENLSLDLKIPPEAVKLLTGFGGGIGDYGSVCGGITGGIMSLGMIYGFDAPSQTSLEDRIGKAGVYKLFNQLPSRFKEKFGTIVCSELVEKFDEVYGKEHLRYCMGVASKSAGIVAELLLEGMEKGVDSFEFTKSIQD